MLSTKKNTSVVGLDIEAGRVAAAEVKTNGASELTGSGVVVLPPGTVSEGEVGNADALADALGELFSSNGLSKSAVRLGIANQKVVVRTMKLPVIEDAEELKTAVRFQAQDQIPMPLDQVVMDFEVVGRSETEGEGGGKQMEVVVVAARRDMLAALIGAMRSAALRPVGIDLSAFGMIRALSSDSEATVPMGANGDGVNGGAVEPVSGSADTAALGQTPARLYCSIGDVTNVAVARGSACVFTRISPFGIEAIAQRLAERRKMTLPDAHKWLGHVGVERSLELIEGDRETVVAAREVMAEGASELAGELRLSLEGYKAQDGSAPIDGIVACGPGTTIPGLPEQLQQELGQALRIGRPRALSGLDDATAAGLTLPYGIALEA